MYFWTKYKNRNSEKCVHLSYTSSLKCHSAWWQALNVNYFQNFVAWRETNPLKIHFHSYCKKTVSARSYLDLITFFAFCLLSSRGRTLNTVYVCGCAYILLSNTAGNIRQGRSYSSLKFAPWLGGKGQRLQKIFCFLVI